MFAATLAVPPAQAFSAPSPEAELKSAVDHLRAGQRDEGFAKLEKLARLYPNFRLAQLLYGEQLAARSGVKNLSPASDPQDQRVKELMEEARLRFSPAASAKGMRAAPLLQLGSQHRYAIAVDLPKARLYVLENSADGPRVVREHYAAMGRNGFGKTDAGDLRTPVGVYSVTGFTGDGQLPELYGSGAFPLSYPNHWDQRLRRSGSGIWLHGVPRDTYSRAPRSSEGCVTMANEDLLALKPYLVAGETPVILADKLDWIAPAQLSAQRDAVAKQIENWRAAWSAKDTEGYLGYYAADFTTDGMGKSAFAEHKRRVNAGKRRIRVKLSDINLIRYPGEQGLVLAEFTQDYDSDNFQVRSRKQQYWKQQAGGGWKILMEESR